MSLLSHVSLRSTHYLAAVALLTGIFCGPTWGADPAPPDESAPFDMRTITIGGQEMRVHTFRDANAGLSWLNLRLRETRHAGSLKSCSALAGVYLTRYEQAFGGICQLRDGEQMVDVKICADTAAGNFSFVPIGNDAKTPEAIAEFVAGNCAGG